MSEIIETLVLPTCNSPFKSEIPNLKSADSRCAEATKGKRVRSAPRRHFFPEKRTYPNISEHKRTSPPSIFSRRLACHVVAPAEAGRAPTEWRQEQGEAASRTKADDRPAPPSLPSTLYRVFMTQQLT